MVVDRILKIIELKGINKSIFYRDTGLSNGFLDKVKDVGVSKIEKILSSYSDINPIWLLTGEGDIFKNEIHPPVEIITPTKVKGRDLMPKVVVVDDADNDRIPLVPIKAQAGYLNGYGDPEYIEKLPTYSVPTLRNGTYRMFQVGGHSMYPTLQNNSYVVGEFVESWEQMSDNRIYVVVTSTEGIIVKRVINRLKEYESLYCKSDNRDYPHISVNVQDIKEVWECKMHLSFEFLDPVTNYQKIADLEIEMLKMREDFEDFKTKNALLQHKNPQKH
ncbi:helix-turn-helix transcriptional regulator [Capnocytophaga canimorsus]|uniref:helix-turn-helix transcriptional regulator n=1 Tax=Capnocytophaga canimorsus TaxID=28188 RepID=UPI0037D0752E